MKDWWPAWFASIEPLQKLIRDGELTDAVVKALDRKGVNSRRNSVGYISVDMDTLREVVS